MPELTPVMHADEINAFLATEFPQMNAGTRDYEVIEIGPGTAHVRLNADDRHLRPGNTVSGPAIWALADIGGYACCISHCGPKALAVTTSLNINFMRKSAPGAIDGHARILKLGRSLLVFDIEIHGADGVGMIAHATGTYALPPAKMSGD